MNLLMVGAGLNGSWQIRGEQLGAALGARVTPEPVQADFVWADVVVLVKKVAPRWAERVWGVGKPLVWDVLDWWLQPSENRLLEDTALKTLKIRCNDIKPTLCVTPTRTMAQAIQGVYLPHHFRPGLTPQPVRREIQVVAYEGSERYLGHWRTLLDQICSARGWRFVVNPHNLAEVDVIVALRDGEWDGWICRQWKSGVKYINALQAERPVISQPSAAWDEVHAEGLLVQSYADLADRFERLRPYEARLAIAERSRQKAPAFRLNMVAAQYREILQSVAEGKSCAA